MPWYFILCIVVVVLFILLFITFISNGDGKLIEVVYDMLAKYHDEKPTNEKI